MHFAIHERNSKVLTHTGRYSALLKQDKSPGIVTLPNSQRGSSLVEAIVALVLVGLITQGAVAMTARAAASQGELRVQEIALTQMREILIANRSGGINLCDPAALPDIQLPDTNITPDVQGCGETISIKIDGTTIDNIPAPLVVSITDNSVGGQIVVGGTWVPDIN